MLSRETLEPASPLEIKILHHIKSIAKLAAPVIQLMCDSWLRLSVFFHMPPIDSIIIIITWLKVPFPFPFPFPFHSIMGFVISLNRHHSFSGYEQYSVLCLSGGAIGIFTSIYPRAQLKIGRQIWVHQMVTIIFVGRLLGIMRPPDD